MKKSLRSATIIAQERKDKEENSFEEAEATSILISPESIEHGASITSL